MNKYYTPENEEFYIGFQYEQAEIDMSNNILKPEKWNKGTIKIRTFDRICMYNDLIHNIRVKYLDKEDIEEILGVRQLKGDDVELNFQIIQEDSKDFYEVDYDIDISELTVELYKEISENRSDCYTLFSGKIKNKSELQKLMKQLGICKK